MAEVEGETAEKASQSKAMKLSRQRDDDHKQKKTEIKQRRQIPPIAERTCPSEANRSAIMMECGGSLRHDDEGSDKGTHSTKNNNKIQSALITHLC